MLLLPIHIEPDKNELFQHCEACVPILAVYPGYYNKIGYHPPWIGYFASLDGEEIVGAAGFKGQPKEGRVEIAYATFDPYQRKGIGTEICSQLVTLALETDPAVRVTARTLQDGWASIRILQKNGFTCSGLVHDEDDGEVLEWEYQKTVG